MRLNNWILAARLEKMIEEARRRGNDADVETLTDTLAVMNNVVILGRVASIRYNPEIIASSDRVRNNIEAESRGDTYEAFCLGYDIRSNECAEEVLEFLVDGFKRQKVKPSEY